MPTSQEAPPRRASSVLAGGPPERGIALVTTLILLVIITLLGLAGIRAATVNQRLSASFDDHQMAYQAANAALIAAVQAIDTQASSIVNCGPGGQVCSANPFWDPDLPGNAIQTVPSGDASGEYSPSPNAAGAPQFVVENMGPWVNPDTSTGAAIAANATAYGTQGRSITSIYYRVTARSSDPGQSAGRAMVTLQAWYRR